MQTRSGKGMYEKIVSNQNLVMPYDFCAKEASLLEVLGYVSHISVRQPSQQVPTYQNGHQQSSRQPILSINIQNEVLPNVDHGREFEIKMLSSLNGYFSVNGRKIVSKFSKYQILPLYTTKLKFLWHTFSHLLENVHPCCHPSSAYSY